MESKTGELDNEVVDVTKKKIPISISRELHGKLIELKKHPRETFEEVVQRLVEQWNLQESS